MNNEIKHKWADALESGKYQQGQHLLRSGDRFCCLGVLCDLHQKETGMFDWEVRGSEESYDGNSCILPQIVAEWAGLESGAPFVSYGGKRASLVELNDDHDGVPFIEIAKLIREQL